MKDKIPSYTKIMTLGAIGTENVLSVILYLLRKYRRLNELR